MEYTGLSKKEELQAVQDDRRYIEEFGLVRPLAIAGTTLYVAEVDVNSCEAGDTITLRDTSTGNEEEVTVSAISATAETITVSTGPVVAYPVGAYGYCFKEVFT